MRDRGSSDPLPFTQLDRTAKAKAATLAGLIGTTPQHALGSLVEFWDLCGDPRDIERLIAEGKSVVSLSPSEVVERFELASGTTVEPRRLAALGFLESLPDGTLRVRGMSRYFEPVQRRVLAREAARAGGLASAKARKKALGTAQPRSGASSTVAQADLEALPKRLPNDSRTGSEAAPEAAVEPRRSHRSEDIVKSIAGDEPPPRAQTPAETKTDPSYRPMTDALCAAFERVVGAKYVWSGGRDGDALKSLRSTAPDSEILRLWEAGLADADKWRGIANLGQLRSKWPDLAKAFPPPRPRPKQISVNELLARQEREATEAIARKRAGR